MAQNHTLDRRPGHDPRAHAGLSRSALHSCRGTPAVSGLPCQRVVRSAGRRAAWREEAAAAGLPGLYLVAPKSTTTPTRSRTPRRSASMPPTNSRRTASVLRRRAAPLPDLIPPSTALLTTTPRSPAISPPDRLPNLSPLPRRHARRGTTQRVSDGAPTWPSIRVRRPIGAGSRSSATAPAGMQEGDERASVHQRLERMGAKAATSNPTAAMASPGSRPREQP